MHLKAANDKMHPSCGGALFTLCQVSRRSRVILVVRRLKPNADHGITKEPLLFDFVTRSAWRRNDGIVHVLPPQLRPYGWRNQLLQFDIAQPRMGWLADASDRLASIVRCIGNRI